MEYAKTYITEIQDNGHLCKESQDAKVKEGMVSEVDLVGDHKLYVLQIVLHYGMLILTIRYCKCCLNGMFRKKKAI